MPSAASASASLTGLASTSDLVATVLAVDDTPESLNLLVHLLTRDGYRVRSADSGERALAAAAEQPPDLVLLDIRMPGVDGLEVCRRLKAHEATRRVPVILVSASAEAREWLDGLELGAVDYVTKPFRPEELLARVRTHLSLSRASAVLEQQAVALRQGNEQLQAEIAKRQRVEDELRQSLERAEDSRSALLSAVEDQEQAEEKLVAITKAVDSASDAIGISDVRGRHFYQNKALSELFGYATADELQAAGGGPAVVKDPEVAKVLFGNIMGGRPWTGELDMVTKCGRVFPAYERADAVKDSDGKVIGLIGIITDITERKRAEREAAARSRRIERQRDVLAALSTSPAIAAGDLVRLARELTEVVALEFGIERVSVWLFDEVGARLVSVDCFEATPRTHAAGVALDESAFRNEFAALKGARYVDASEPLTDPRTAGYVESYIKPLRITAMLDAVVRTEGRSLGVVCLEHVDRPHRWEPDEITFACQLGDQVAITLLSFGSKRAEAGRLRSHELLANLARLVPGVVYQYRLYPDGRSAFPYASPGIDAIYEVTPEAVREDATPVFERLHPSDYDRVAASIQESARTLREFYCEFRVNLPRQGLRWRWSQAHPERTEDGGTLWHGIILDVTERKLAQEASAALETQLQQVQKMESVGRLAGGVAHDFNNLLTGIMNYVELCRDELPAAHPIRNHLAEITADAQRSADITGQLLAFARKQVVDPKVLDLNDALVGMLKMLQHLIGEDISLTWAPAVHLWTVKIDPGQLNQILANLCVNARDAIAGVGRVAIETGCVTLDAAYCAGRADAIPGDYVRLTVSDTGCGMDKETLAHLFEPFFTTKAMGKGTGLGLATVYGVVKQAGGHIGVLSEPGVGTTFSVYLPRAASAADVGREVATAVALPRGTETVLIAEDEKSVRITSRAFLEQLGYVVLVAETPAEARRQAGAHSGPIHLLITDVIMPGMNGPDLAALLAEARPNLKCLFMSGYTADVMAQRGALGAGLPFLPKPFSRADLARKVREVLDGGRAATAAR